MPITLPIPYSDQYIYFLLGCIVLLIVASLGALIHLWRWSTVRRAGEVLLVVAIVFFVIAYLTGRYAGL